MTTLQKRTAFAFGFLFLILSSCDNTIKLAAPWKDVPLVYAILDPSRASQYVRVEKVFLDPEKSAVEVAQIADSLYYPESAISVFLINKRTGKQVQLSRIDGTNDGIPRKSGVFATQPNWLYKTATSELGSIQAGDSIMVEVRRSDTNLAPTSAATRLPDQMKIIAPNTNDQLLILSDRKKAFSWTADGNSELFNGFVNIISRRMNGNNIVRRDTAVWQVASNLLRGSAAAGSGFQTAVDVDGIGFFQALHDRFINETLGANEYRLMENVQFVVVGGGKEIREFQVSLNAASGVSGAEAVPIFTNVTNGLGLVTAINRSPTAIYTLKAETITEIKTHPLTKNLGFQN